MTNDVFVKRRMRQLVREELSRTDVRNVIREEIAGMDFRAFVREVLYDESYGRVQQRPTSKLKVVKQ